MRNSTTAGHRKQLCCHRICLSYFGLASILIIWAFPPARAAAAELAPYTPTQVSELTTEASTQPIAVRGIVTQVGGWLAIVEDQAAYEGVGECCSPFGPKTLILQRESAIWNFRERYEGSTVVARGLLKQQICAPNFGKMQCYNLRSFAVRPDDITIVGPPRERPVVPPDRVSMPTLADAGKAFPELRAESEAPKLHNLANKLLAAIAHNDAAAIVRFFAPVVYPTADPGTFRNEMSDTQVSTPADVQRAYGKLFVDTHGRARWLLFSREAGPSRNARHELFTEMYPAHELRDALLCFTRERANAGRWPRSVQVLHTPQTADPYICIYAIKVRNRWWIDFERTFFEPGLFAPVP